MKHKLPLPEKASNGGRADALAIRPNFNGFLTISDTFKNSPNDAGCQGSYTWVTQLRHRQRLDLLTC